MLVLAGVMLGMVSFNAMPGERQVLQQEAQRIAYLMQLARDEAILRNLPVAFEADGQRYRFLIRQGSVWMPLTGDDMLREREFKRAPIGLAIDPPPAGNSLPLRLVFGREPVDKPFVMTLSYGQSSVTVSADGIGHYVVN